MLSIALCLALSGAPSGAFDPRQVPAEAAWVVHVDLAALAQSTFLRELHADGIRFENEFNLDHVERDYGLDPFADLRSLTFYGSGAGGEECACVAVGSSALQSAWTRLSERGARPVRIAGLQAVQVGHGGGAGYFALLPGEPSAASVAIVAASEAALRSAWLVAQREAPTLADPNVAAESPRTKSASRERSSAIQARPGKGSLVFAASQPAARFEENAIFLRSAGQILDEIADLSAGEADTVALAARALEFELAENQGDLQVSLAIDAVSPAKAASIEQVLRGAMSRATVGTDSPETARRVMQLLGALQLSSDGSRFIARFRYSARRFLDDVAFIEEARGVRPGR